MLWNPQPQFIIQDPRSKRKVVIDNQGRVNSDSNNKDNK